jgi:hypothetical protein
MANFQAIGVVLEKESQGITDVVVLTVDGKEQMYSIADAIALINNGDELYTEYAGWHTPIYIVSGKMRGIYLRSAPTWTTEDNLLSLRRYTK